MVSERKEPTLSGSDMTLEERSARSESLRAQEKPKKPAASPKRAPSATAAPAGKSSPIAALALVIGLTGLGLAGFSYWQLLQAQKTLIESEQRIVELEQRLNLSSDESSESLTVLQANLKEANHEIAKLWDTRNVNRKGIADNKTAINDLEKSVKTAAANMASLKKTVADNSGSIKALDTKVVEVNTAAGKALALAAAQEKSLKALSQQLDKASSGIGQLGDLNVRIKTNEEAIEAIDAYRHQINRQIIDLQNKVGP